MLITIAVRDMFGKIERQPDGMFTCRRLIKPGVTTIKEVEALDIHWWPQGKGDEPIPGYAVFKIKEDGTLIMLYETPDKEGT